MPRARASRTCSAERVSSRLTRVIRATMAMGPSENAITGMMRCFGSPQPPVGSHCSCTATTMTRMDPMT